MHFSHRIYLHRQQMRFLVFPVCFHCKICARKEMKQEKVSKRINEPNSNWNARRLNPFTSRKETELFDSDRLFRDSPTQMKKKKNTSNLCTYTLICRIAPYLPKISYISSDVILYGKFLMYRTRLTSGGSRIWEKTKKKNNQ